MARIIDYKGYDIEYNFYGRKEYSVQYCGDDLVFFTEAAAKEFIDSVTEEINLCKRIG